MRPCQFFLQHTSKNYTSELLFGRGGSADAIVNVAPVEFRFWAVVLAKNLMFDKT